MKVKKSVGEKDHLSQNKMKNISVKETLKKNLKKHVTEDIPSNTKSYEKFEIVKQPIMTVGDSQISFPERSGKLIITSTGNNLQVLSKKSISPDSVSQEAKMLKEESNSIKTYCYDEKISEKLFDEEFKSFYDKSLMLEKVINNLECSPMLLSERKNAVKEFMDGLSNSCSKEILESGKRVSESFPSPYECGETVCQEIIEDLNEGAYIY